MCGQKHVVSLDRGADEKAGEWDNRKTEAFGQVLVRKGLCARSALGDAGMVRGRENTDP